MDDGARDMPRTHMKGNTSSRWIARLGVGYLIFCFIKGLVWLGLGAGAWVAMTGD